LSSAVGIVQAMVAGKLRAGDGASNHVGADPRHHEEKFFRVTGHLGDLYQLFESMSEIREEGCGRMSSEDGNVVTRPIPNREPDDFTVLMTGPPFNATNYRCRESGQMREGEPELFALTRWQGLGRFYVLIDQQTSALAGLLPRGDAFACALAAVPASKGDHEDQLEPQGPSGNRRFRAMILRRQPCPGCWTEPALRQFSRHQCECGELEGFEQRTIRLRERSWVLEAAAQLVPC
jgi:hypothetical protein